MAISAVADRSLGWALGAAAALALAWSVRRGSLGAVVGAALLALLAVLVPLRLLFVAERDLATYATFVLALAFGAACLPDVVLLLRDAELQNAYGLWARRGAPRRLVFPGADSLRCRSMRPGPWLLALLLAAPLASAQVDLTALPVGALPEAPLTLASTGSDAGAPAAGGVDLPMAQPLANATAPEVPVALPPLLRTLPGGAPV